MRRAGYVGALLCFVQAAGCAALSNPALEGIPVRLLPEELRGKSVEGFRPIPLNLLSQPEPDAYRVGPKDVLGVWVEGALGELRQPPPLLPAVVMDGFQFPQSTGYPIQVQLDGTISLPLLNEPIRVQGMTLPEVEATIRRTYSEKGILKTIAEKANVAAIRVSVSLARPRTYHILVLREDSTIPTGQSAMVAAPIQFGTPEYIGGTRKGNGYELNLPVYRNDVLTAIAKSGGLPGSDALDEVIIQRNSRHEADWPTIIQDFNSHGIPYPTPGTPIYRIPLRARPGTLMPFRPEDIVLGDGDVLYIPARQERLFYTGGLIPPGNHILPRDTDLDILEALTRVRAPFLNGLFASLNYNGAAILPGLGQPSATLVTVIRKLPKGGQVPIRVDLAKAIRNPRERILVQPGDLIVMQETPEQGIVRYLTQTIDFIWINKYFQTPWGMGTFNLSAPGGVAPSTISPMFISTSTPIPTAGALPGTAGAASSSSSVLPIATPSGLGSPTTGSLGVR